MAGLALVLSSLAILVQFYGVLSEHDTIVNKFSDLHRFKRSHEYDFNIQKSTNNTKPGKTVIPKSTPVTKKLRDQLLSKETPKVVKLESMQADNETVTMKQTDKLQRPKHSQHFIEDITPDSPVDDIQFNQPKIKKNPVKAFANETSKIAKSPKINHNIDNNITKKITPENNMNKSTNELIPRFRTAEPNKAEKKLTLKELANFNNQFLAKLPNKVQERMKDESLIDIPKLPTAVLDFKRKDQEHENIIEIKEHKYEEEVVRVNPTKYCQPNIRRYSAVSQNFNPQFSKTAYIQRMNPYQGLYTQADTYQSSENTYNKDKYYSGYTCKYNIDPSNGNYFYANFDTNTYNQANVKQNCYRGYENCDRIRKIWLNRQTTIRTPNNLDQYAARKINDHLTITNEQYQNVNKPYQNIMKKSYDFNNNALSNNPYARYNPYQ